MRARRRLDQNPSLTLATRYARLHRHSVSIPGTVAGWSDLLARHGRMTLTKPTMATRHLDRREWLSREQVRSPTAGARRDGCAVTLTGRAATATTARNGPAATRLLIDGRTPRGRNHHAHPHAGCDAEQALPPRTGLCDLPRRLCPADQRTRQRYGGWITPADMAACASTWDEPITADYRGVRLA